MISMSLRGRDVGKEGREGGREHTCPMGMHKNLGAREMAQWLRVSCSCRELWFSAKLPNDITQLPVTLLPGVLLPSSGLHGHCMYMVHIYMQAKHLYI